MNSAFVVVWPTLWCCFIASRDNRRNTVPIIPVDHNENWVCHRIIIINFVQVFLFKCNDDVISIALISHVEKFYIFPLFTFWQDRAFYSVYISYESFPQLLVSFVKNTYKMGCCTKWKLMNSDWYILLWAIYLHKYMKWLNRTKLMIINFRPYQHVVHLSELMSNPIHYSLGMNMSTAKTRPHLTLFDASDTYFFVTRFQE